MILSNLPKNQFSQNIKKNDNEILDAKMEIYKCANLVNPLYYPNKFNLILQTAIEDVANFLNEEIYFITKKLFPFMEYDIAYLLDFGPKFFKILYGLEDIYDFEERSPMMFDYDISQNFFSKYLKNSRTNLVKEQLKFIGDAFVSQVFTHKNKMQLLKFLASNVKNSHAAKDPFLRIQKLFSLLVITLAIVNKIYHENKGEEVEMEMLEVFKEICESSWTFVNNHARITCALIYAMLFKLSKSTDFQDTLMRNLYDGLSDPVKAPTISVVVGCIFKFHPQMDKKLFIQLVNIFQKSSRNQDGTNAIWLINSLRLGLEHAPDYSRDLIKACLPFLMRYHYENKTSGRVSFIAWCYLIEILTKRINSLNIERMYHIDALVVDLDNTDFVIPDNFLKDAKLTLTSAILNNQQLHNQIKLKYTKYLVKMLHSPSRAGKIPRLPEKAYELTQSLVEKGETEQINLFDSKFNQIYLDKMNSICNKRDPEVEKIEKIYHRFLTVQLQLLKLKLSSFEDQLLFFKEYVFPEKEHIQEGENKEGDKPLSSAHIGKIEFNKDFGVALKTRVYALRCIENLLQYTNVQTFKAKDVVNFTALIIPFVFKVASSPFEETKEMGMKIFHHLLSKLLNFSETGEDLNTMVEGEKTPLMLQYGAQIDSLIRFNIKDINENSAASVQSSLKLFNKFFRLMYNDDFTMVKRLFALVISGIQAPIKLTQSSYHSEKALTEIHFTRVRILCKVLQYFKENMQKEEILRNEYENFFPPLLKKYLEQNLAAILEDSGLVVMFSRRLLKNYENFHFIYNGTKISYDSKSVFTNLPIFISTYFILIKENPPVADIIKALPEGEMKKCLKNNQKLIPPNQAIIQICLLLCNFLLTHNEVYENNNEANLRRLKKVYDYNLFKVFKEKIVVLKSLQIMLSDEEVVAQNKHLFVELLSILNNYMTLSNPDIINEIFKIFIRVLTHQSLNDTFEVITTSLTLFYYTSQPDILANPDPWTDTSILFLNMIRILIFKLCSFNQQDGASFAARLSFFLKLVLTYIFSKSPRLQIESIRIFKQIFETVLNAATPEQTKAIIVDSLEKFISLIINKLNDANVPLETKIRLIDLLLGIEQTWKREKTIFEEATIFISRDSDLVKLYLLNLRNIWRTTRQIPPEALPRVLSLIKCSLEQMQSAKGLTNQHNELVAEILKMFLYFQLEGPGVNKQVFAEALLGFITIIVDLQLNPTTSAILTQVIQHIYGSLQPVQVKQMLTNLNENQRKTLCDYSQVLKTINEQNFDAQQTNAASAAATQGTAEKTTGIKLKAFGKK